jgi:hypothetical protein
MDKMQIRKNLRNIVNNKKIHSHQRNHIYLTNEIKFGSNTRNDDISSFIITNKKTKDYMNDLLDNNTSSIDFDIIESKNGYNEIRVIITLNNHYMNIPNSDYRFNFWIVCTTNNQYYFTNKLMFMYSNRGWHIYPYFDKNEYHKYYKLTERDITIMELFIKKVKNPNITIPKKYRKSIDGIFKLFNNIYL